MTSIRPSMPGISQTGPLQNVQRQQAAPKAEEAKAPPPKEESAAMGKDENKTKNFDDTPMMDVNAFPFAAEAKASEATTEIEGLFEAEETGEAEASEESGEAEETEEGGEVEGEGEVEDAAEIEAGEVEEEEEEEADAGDFEDSEGGAEAEQLIHLAPLLEILPQLREIQKFRIEETWMLYG